MRRILITSTAVAAVLALAASAYATAPAVNGATVQTRVFNDCPGSILTTVNTYPASIVTDDANTACVGGANLHGWKFSADGGATDAVFQNGDDFKFSADLLITGTGEGEAGLSINPWWSQYVDGRFNVRSTDGEIACFGGRLPFFSFTGAFGLNYAKGNTIHLEVIYHPNGLSLASPGTIQYNLVYLSNSYTSGVLTCDQGNAAEDPPHGQWGILQPSWVGGHHQFFVFASPPGTNSRAEWKNIGFEAGTVGVEATNWTAVKGLYR